MDDALTANAHCPRSLELQDRGKKIIPGLTQLLSKRPDQFAPDVWPAYYSRAEGAYVWDLDGNRYLDMSIGGIGATVLGYADPDVDDAVRGAISRGVACSLNCPEEIELAELLCELHPWAEMVRLARTGGEATTMAVRIARAATGRDKVAICGYHGWHDWYLAANLADDRTLDGHLLPGLRPAGVPRALKGTARAFAYNRLDQLQQIVSEIGSELAAIVMEPIRSAEPQNGFLQEVRRIASRTRAVLIFDEISAGFRLTTGGAHLVLGVEPDVAVFSKAIANGYAMAAVIGRRAVMEAAQDSFISSTMWTESIGPSAALATIYKFRRLNVADHLVSLGRRVQQGWTEAAERNGLAIDVGGMRPMSHFVFEDDLRQSMKAYLVQLMLQRGYLASNAFYAMYAHTHQDVEQYLQAVDVCFAEVQLARRTGNLDRKMVGQPAAAGFGRLA
ncbi:MAG: aminotransferase class III-fold pyridoxal phosphate-dependent enzyme [bacterium]